MIYIEFALNYYKLTYYLGCNDESHLCPELVSDLSCENEYIAHLCPSSCDNCNPECK